jgi:hypothetical protein
MLACTILGAQQRNACIQTFSITSAVQAGLHARAFAVPPQFPKHMKENHTGFLVRVVQRAV